MGGTVWKSSGLGRLLTSAGATHCVEVVRE